MTIIFNAIGAVSIDRSAKNYIVEQIAAEFSKRDHFIPVIFPEGTRSKVTGYLEYCQASQCSSSVTL